MFKMRLENSGFESNGFSTLQSAVQRKLSERGCGLDDAGITVSLDQDSLLNLDEYRVNATEEAVRITAGGMIGAFAGMGDYLRHCGFDGRGNCRPDCGIRHVKPQNPIHGIYFASHFHNFYETAPLKKVQLYIEDLALQGCNALMIWYDMHQYADVDVPESVAMIARLKSILRHASVVGMKTVFTMLANESFYTSDPAIRAEWQVQNGYFATPVGHYHVEICPDKPHGLEEILRQRRRVMNAFSDVKLDYLAVWPYDQGGCTCEKCAPWGANGYLKTLKALHELFDEILPDSKILCSTWYFNHFVLDEWDRFNEAMNSGEYSYVDALFGYFANGEEIPGYIREGKMPGGKPMVAFPEISMYGATPWGGFGANPMPRRMEANFRENGNLYCGALPYSEGIFEDINKSLMLAFYGGRTDSAEEVLREYARFELCLNGSLEDDFVRMVYAMETTLNRTGMDRDGNPIDWNRNTGFAYDELRYIIQNPDLVMETEALAAKIDQALPDSLRQSWRWRILRLRAMIDVELKTHDMSFSPKFEACMEALSQIYHAETAFYVVTPLTRRAVQNILGGTI